MTCAPFRVEASKVRRPLFPTVKACQELREHETHPECWCRAYPNRGHYVIGTCGHAHGWNLHRVDAVAQAARLVIAPGALSPGAAPPPAAPVEDPRQITFMDFVHRGAAAQAAVDDVLEEHRP